VQNIDPVLFLQPALAIAISLGSVIYWWYTRGFRGGVLLLSVGAYFLAIAAKYAIQLPTLHLVEAAFGPVSAGLGLYYGFQTVLLEVGLAYLFALIGARRWSLNASDAVPYGLSLAFWENGILLGAISLLNLGAMYLLLGTGSIEAATVYTQLVAAQPALFLPPALILPSVLLGVLERVSSMLVHMAWGVLCLIAAVSGRRRYLVYALPMGLIDALVPFASLNTDLFEASIFLLSAAFVLFAGREASSYSRASGPERSTVERTTAS
jgi:hypothetical protein